MSTALATWIAWFLQSVAELTLLLALCCGVDRYARLRWRPQVRNVLWLVVLARLLLPPGVVWDTRASPVFEATVPFELEGATMPGFGIEHALALVWVFGVACVLASWPLRAKLSATRLESGGDAATSLVERVCRDLAIARLPRVQIDRAAASPYVAGLIAPRVVLPATWSFWPQDVLVHAIAHELTHLRRRDLWVESLWMVATALYWFHPLVHVARRQAYEAREMCCDADTARRVGTGYRSSMLQLVASAAGVSAGLQHRAPHHGLSPAIERLLALRRWSSAPTWQARIAALILAFSVAVIALPGHVRLSAAVHAPALAIPIEPLARQQRGLGSLHLRYAMQQEMAAEEKARQANNQRDEE